MAEITLKLILPKWRMAMLRAAIYAMAAGYHLRLISAARVEAAINPLADWAIKGVRVR